MAGARQVGGSLADGDGVGSDPRSKRRNRVLGDHRLRGLDRRLREFRDQERAGDRSEDPQRKKGRVNNAATSLEGCGLHR
ncbi:hypothetical protein NDU88_004442 [Pleurodeles waltl]|uniref:Uncharacterized protein n=1 Tax=Pleurodeles waltl TaxID=8319 RepID=A0AAV7NNG0_PLEWA|nr:hypothetical protein NDU88_004442 [Pleurodeles waltl]